MPSVARLRGVSLGLLQASPLVEWVGEYRPAYKVHPRLAAAARAARCKPTRSWR